MDGHKTESQVTESTGEVGSPQCAPKETGSSVSRPQCPSVLHQFTFERFKREKRKEKREKRKEKREKRKREREREKERERERKRERERERVRERK